MLINYNYVLTNSTGNTFLVYTFIMPLKVLLIILLDNFRVPFKAPCPAFKNHDKKSIASPESS